MALRKKTGASSKSRATKQGSVNGRNATKAAKSKSAKKTSTKKSAKKNPAKQKTAASKTHVAVPGSRRPPTKGSTRLRAADPQSHVEVTLTLRGPKLPDANHLPTHALTSEDYQARY